eukprot:TRINITY_DN2067_c0_g1_i1.p1 TRINITY_DN2067_c0_g1~~TRINITY_DN2067_c0_g1_i1.p1  ORF type:complete len:243 (+),score=59.57 TRINITY_DN2067_c0_g1_i1:628-1356(+)
MILLHCLITATVAITCDGIDSTMLRGVLNRGGYWCELAEHFAELENTTLDGGVDGVMCYLTMKNEQLPGAVSMLGTSTAVLNGSALTVSSTMSVPYYADAPDITEDQASNVAERSNLAQQQSAVIDYTTLVNTWNAKRRFSSAFLPSPPGTDFYSPLTLRLDHLLTLIECSPEATQDVQEQTLQVYDAFVSDYFAFQAFITDWAYNQGVSPSPKDAQRQYAHVTDVLESHMVPVFLQDPSFP